MRELMQDLLDGDYTTEDVCTIIETLRYVGSNYVQLNKSNTPEATALARWGVEIAEKEWRETCSTYGLKQTHASTLFY